MGKARTRLKLATLLLVAFGVTACGAPSAETRLAAEACERVAVVAPAVRSVVAADAFIEMGGQLDEDAFLSELNRQCGELLVARPAVVGGADVSDAHAEQIVMFVEDLNQAWYAGPERAVQFIVEHNHPELGLFASDYPCLGGVPDGYRDLLVVASISADPKWVYPDVGTPLDGRVPPADALYLVGVEGVVLVPGSPPAPYSDQFHVAIVAGEARAFQRDPSCG